jgi:hypothetical protein
LIFDSDSNPITSPYTVPEGYTSMTITIIAGGGGSGAGGFAYIGGGGSGSRISGTTSIVAGNVLTVTRGIGGTATNDGTATLIGVGAAVLAQAGPGGAGITGNVPGSYGGAKGLPQVVGSFSSTNGNDGQSVNTGGAAVDGIHGGGGTNGIASGRGGDGYYRIIFS